MTGSSNMGLEFSYEGIELSKNFSTSELHQNAPLWVILQFSHEDRELLQRYFYN